MAILSERIEGKTIEVDINSTNLKSAKYDTETKDLTITFINESIYLYKDVPWEVFVKLRIAESQGKYFNVNIARKYQYQKVK
jgi:hypothetical protein